MKPIKLTPEEEIEMFIGTVKYVCVGLVALCSFVYGLSLCIPLSL